MKIPAILLFEIFHKPGSLGGKTRLQTTLQIVFAAVVGRGVDNGASLPGLIKGEPEAAAPRCTDGMRVTAAQCYDEARRYRGTYARFIGS